MNYGIEFVNSVKGISKLMKNLDPDKVNGRIRSVFVCWQAVVIQFVNRISPHRSRRPEVRNGKTHCFENVPKINRKILPITHLFVVKLKARPVMLFTTAILCKTEHLIFRVLWAFVSCFCPYSTSLWNTRFFYKQHF